MRISNCSTGIHQLLLKDISKTEYSLVCAVCPYVVPDGKELQHKTKCWVCDKTFELTQRAIEAGGRMICGTCTALRYKRF